MAKKPKPRQDSGKDEAPKRVVLKLNETEKIIAEFSEWKGKRSLDIRQYWFNQGEWRATGKGVKIPVDDANRFTLRLRKMVRAAME